METTARMVGHGKVILFGEHAVVYGRRAVALATGPGCEAWARPALPGEPDSLTLWPFGTRVWFESNGRRQFEPAADESEYSRVLRLSFATAWAGAPSPRPSMAIEARLLLPSGAGLGSSAALSVAVARAIDQVLGQQRDDGALVEASVRWEQVCHGNPSGVDSALAVYGGALEFRRGAPPVSLRDVTLPPLVVGNVGPAPSTRIMVERVAANHRRDPEGSERLFDAIDSLADAGRNALMARDWQQLGALMLENHERLVQLELSTGRLDDACRLAMAHGALGAKLTGGGGGGCMIALCPDPPAAARLQTVMAEQGLDAFTLGGA